MKEIYQEFGEVGPASMYQVTKMIYKSKDEKGKLEELLGHKPSKDEKILYEIYQRIYAEATPKADFYELWKNAGLDERGKKDIKFNDYEIDDDVMSGIIKSTLKEFKIPKYRRESYNVAIYLGCSPRTKR